MKKYLPLLKETVLLKEIPEDILTEEILPHGYLREYAKSQCPILPQQRVDWLGVVVSGKIHVTHIFASGNDSLMDVITPGKILGADLVCTGSRISPYHAIAAGTAQILYFPGELFLQPGMLREEYRQQILARLLLLIANQNIKKEYRLAILAQKGLRDRILTYLTMQANKRQSGSFCIPFTRDELASYLCVNRSALSHELSLMEQEGLITFRKNRFTLCNYRTHAET